MEISADELPYAGELFRFAVRGASGPTRIEVYIDSRIVIEDDCPDPPCHEMIRIPHGVRGSTLQIIARDSAGESVEQSFIIIDMESGANSAMSAGG